MTSLYEEKLEKENAALKSELQNFKKDAFYYAQQTKENKAAYTEAAGIARKWIARGADAEHWITKAMVVLKAIRDIDYRGNRCSCSAMAFEFLKNNPPTENKIV